jgi:uncharacterized membrane protein YebE (DUF533 family)
MYTILPYTKEKAKQMGLTVLPSTKKGKKLDVYKEGKLIASIGALGYKDYPTYLKEDGPAVANERRRLYRLRHTKNTPNEKLSLNLLW